MFQEDSIVLAKKQDSYRVGRILEIQEHNKDKTKNRAIIQWLEPTFEFQSDKIAWLSYRTSKKQLNYLQDISDKITAKEFLSVNTKNWHEKINHLFKNPKTESEAGE